MTLCGKIMRVAATLGLLAFQPASAQDNGTVTEEKPAAPEALPSAQATPIVTPPDQPPVSAAPDQPATPAPAPPPPKPDEAAQQPKPPEPAAKVSTFVQGQVAPILGKKVVGSDEKQVVGSIIDLLVDDEGKPRAAVLDLGGFLGVGSRHVAIDWHLLRFRAAKPDAPAVLNLDPEDLKAAPEYKDVNAAAQVVEPAHAPADTVPPASPPASAVEDSPATDKVPANGAPNDSPPPAPEPQPSVPGSAVPQSSPEPPANDAGQ